MAEPAVVWEKMKGQNMRTIQFGILLGFVTVAMCYGGPVSITNPSFESPAQATGVFTFDNATGWTVTGYGGVWNPQIGPNNGSNFFSSIPNGNEILFDGYSASADATQSLGVSLLANTVYTLTYWVGQRYDVPLSTYTVALKAGSTVLASDSAGAPGAGSFVQRTITFTTGASPVAGVLNLDFAATGFAVNGAPGQTEFDMVALDASPSVTGPTPEPASIGLIGFGLVGAALVARRKRVAARS
jgi:hypothetical protein